MTKTLYALALLLGVQLALIVGLHRPGPADLAARPETAMLSFAAKDVDKLTIAGPSEDSVTLARGDKGWVLPDLSDFPADGGKVDALLGKLVGLREGPPVATSKDALARFRLTDDAHERRIAFSGGGKDLGTVYIGTGQGVRSVNARRGDQDAVYQVAFASYEAQTAPDSWIDKSVLQVPEDQITAIDVDGLRLERGAAADPKPGEAQGTEETEKAGTWQLSGGTAEQSLKPGAADALAGLIAGLSVDGIVKPADESQYDPKAPAADLSVTLADGSTRQITVSKATGKESYALRASTLPPLLRLSGTTATQLIDAAGLETLVGAPTAPPAEPPAPDATGGSG